MSGEKALLPCYNRGCGQKFDPNDNKDDDCIHHPGVPVFHDAYKGWSCCNKKCTDFTEFLNIKGCTKSRHTNEKPPEPEKPAVDKSKAAEIIEVRCQPLNNEPSLERPPYDTPQVTMSPVISPALVEQVKGLVTSDPSSKKDKTIAIGQSCKNNSCKSVYSGPASNEETCTYHPGVPIFHEGLKFWSCCQKKTTDFTVFLEQPGCSEGCHTWLPKETSKKIQCRLDWHQTGSFVVISIYAKKYNPDRSVVKLNPIRLTVDLFFPEESSSYKLDTELRGIVNVEESSVSMLPTKVEVKLKKAEVGSWSTLDFPRPADESSQPDTQNEDCIASKVDAVDLSDL